MTEWILLYLLAGLPGPASTNSNRATRLFDARRPATGQRAVLMNRDDCHVEARGGQSVLLMKRGTDPYHEPSWDFRLADDILADRRSCVLEVVFYDEGAGVIEPRLLSDAAYRGAWAEATRHSSYTRLNTLTLRSGFFRFDVPSLDWPSTEKPHLKITGLQYLVALKLHDALSEPRWQAAKRSVPAVVTPMVHLDRPMQIVCSAGVATRSDRAALRASLDALHELAPLAKVLGFNAIESYVRWNLVEPTPGRFDFSPYDAVVAELRTHGLQWFPLLIVGSAYALPEWFAGSAEDVGFVCLEHGRSNRIQSIWSPYHKKHVRRFLTAFGRHYEPMKVLQGVRLGPSGNYGESQYPAGGNWGYRGERMHIHIGYWAGDRYARKAFRRHVRAKYATIQRLNATWETTYKSFDDVQPCLPDLLYNRRERLDMAQWYTQAMTEWCGWWVAEARKAMPNTKIYQSAGGWGFHESGTDYVGQARSMVSVGGGIRLTNETDSFQQNFYATRLAATAARLYGIDLGFEPASSHTARGTVARIFNTTATHGDHFFTYAHNVFTQQMSVAKWLENYRTFDLRQDPIVDVALYYPETMNELDRGTFGHLYAWGFNPRAREIRRHVEVDYLDESLIREGYLDRYKVLVFCWGDIIEADVEAAIDRWVRAGGVLVYPSFPRGSLQTVEGDRSIFTEWARGNAGHGAFYRYRGDMEPPRAYAAFVASVLPRVPDLHPWTRAVLQVQHPEDVFFSIQQDGHLLAINYRDDPARVSLAGHFTETIPPYAIARLPLRTSR